jgi:hypothetical protein
MYRENAPPPAPDPREAARQAVTNCVHIQLGVAALNAVTFVLLTIQFAFYRLPAQLNVPLEAQHEVRAYVLAAAVAYVVVFGAWAGLNAWGLRRRSKLARWSSIGFAAATMATCCATIFGGFLLYQLLRRDVKSYFD